MKDVDSLLAEALARVASRAAGVDGEDVETARLEDDLGIDSLGLLNLVAGLESELGIVIPDEEMGRFRTVGDIRQALRWHTSVMNGEATR